MPHDAPPDQDPHDPEGTPTGDGDPFEALAAPDGDDDYALYAVVEYVDESMAAGHTVDALARRLAESPLDLRSLGRIGARFVPNDTWEPVDPDRLVGAVSVPGTPNPYGPEHEVVQRAIQLRLRADGAARPADEDEPGEDGGEPRQRVLVEAGPHVAREADALGDYERYRAALTARYGAPSIDDAPRPHPNPELPDQRVTTWETGRADDGPDEVELALFASAYNYGAPWSLQVYKVYVRQPATGGRPAGNAD